MIRTIILFLQFLLCFTCGYLLLKYATVTNTDKALIMMTLSTSMVSLKLAMIAIAAKYWL